MLCAFDMEWIHRGFQATAHVVLNSTPHMPSTATEEHFPTIRHNRIRDLTAQLLTDVCPSVEIEPHLQPLFGETFPHQITNLEDNARLDVKALGFWGNERQCAFFDVRVFNPFAPSHANQTIQSTYRKNEKEKRRQYENEKRITNIEHGSVTPLVMSATGGMGPSAGVFYKRLARMISQKHFITILQDNEDDLMQACLFTCGLGWSLSERS